MTLMVYSGDMWEVSTVEPKLDLILLQMTLIVYFHFGLSSQLKLDLISMPLLVASSCIHRPSK